MRLVALCMFATLALFGKVSGRLGGRCLIIVRDASGLASGRQDNKKGGASAPPFACDPL